MEFSAKTSNFAFLKLNSAIMKITTNILLLAAVFVYVLTPFLQIAFQGDMTGLDYTAATINKSTDIIRQLFSLAPFVACFGGIFFNCFKHRYWGFVVLPFVVLGIGFYEEARRFALIESPEFFNITGMGWGFKAGYVLMVAALVSAVISLLPFAFNMIHEISDKRKKK